MLFNHRYSIESVIFCVFPIVIFLLLSTGCGGNGCRTPEQTINGGLWESSQFVQIKPLNPEVIKQESQFGSYVLHDGVTEAMAKENLWYELKTQSNSDVIVTSGNKFTMDVSGSVILSGSSQMLNVRLNDYIKLDGGITSGSKVEPEEKKITSRKPTKIIQTIKYLFDGTYEYKYKYEVKDDDGVNIVLDSNQVTKSDGCTSDIEAKEKINYIWYFPKKIIFHKWIDENFNLVNKVVVVDTEENGLSCGVSSANGVLWYVCTFNYKGSNLQYKRRVTPVIVANYPQFEEQVSKPDEEISQLLSRKSKAKGAQEASGMDACYNPDDEKPDMDCMNRIIDQAGGELDNVPQLTDEEYKQNYYMCIVGGKSSNNADMCAQYKFGTIGTEDDRITPKSPIMVVFKTHDEIYDSRAKKNYDNQKCFQQDEYKNRFLPESSAYSKTFCVDEWNVKQELKYQQFCRMAPKKIEYNLHKIRRKNEYDWLDHDASQEEIEYCSKYCLKKEGYDLQKTVGECPNDCAIQLYEDYGASEDKSISDPVVVSCVDYQHRRRKEVDLRAGSKYDDANNTLYYAIDKNLIDGGKIEVVRPESMNWSQARIPCIEATGRSDTAGYRRLSTSLQDCCRDFTNTMKVKNPDTQQSGYFMCDDKIGGADCRTSLLTSTVCNASMIAQGNCYHIFSSDYPSSDGDHAFCDGYENDLIINNIKFTKANAFDTTKPAYLVSADAMREYIGGSVDIPKKYPGDDDDGKNVGLEYGLMPVASDDVTLIECVDDVFSKNLDVFEDRVFYVEKPEGYDDMEENAKKQFKIVPDNCKVEGNYTTYKSSNEVLFSKGDAGIIPMQWSVFPVRAGQSVPITITSRYPILVKSGDQYIEMHNGNGLMVYLDPNDDDDNSNSLYDPELWQCNMGVGGSYAYYRPYEYSSLAVKSERNPRKITTPNEMWWYCDDERPMWFSGYDFKNIKTGKPVYMHTYNVNDVKRFLPQYEEGGVAPSHDDLPVEKVGCNEDGLPSSMVVDGKLYEHANITGLLYDTSLGPQYIYSDGTTQKTIPVSDSSITSKTYERFEPKIIVVDLTDEGLTNVQIQADTEDKEYNGLRRTYKKDNEGRILQAYYEFKYFSKDYKIRVEDSVIHKPSICYNEGEFAPTDAPSEDEITKITDIKFTDDNKYYVLNKSDDFGEIFTRFGPFSGMHVNTSGLLLPAIYTTEGACLEHFIYDEQHEKSPEGNTYMSKWFRDETRILRKNLSKPWRMEFTTPALEYNGGEYLVEEMPDNSTGTLSRCYNKYNFEGCGVDKVPDIILVDLSKTNNAAKKSVSGSVVLYKDENFVKYKDKYYYPVTFAPLGWDEYLLDKEDPMISSVKCSGYGNCGEDEIPVIELTANGVHYRIENGDSIDGKLVKIGKRQRKSALSFDIIIPGDNYSAGNYTIDNPVLDKNAICFTANKICKSYLDRYIGVDTINEESEICDESDSMAMHEIAGNGMVISKKVTTKDCKAKNEYLYSLSRSPYVVACQNDKILDEGKRTEITSIYSTPYSTSKVYSSSKIGDGGYVLKTNIYDFVTNQYFARCVPSWFTPRWMLMDQPNDPSTFSTGYTAISGTYIAPDGKDWSVDYVKDKYHLESAWKNYGGIVKNSVMNQSCSKSVLPDGTTYKSSCNLKGEVKNFNASFTARYPKQLIMVKPIVNDPINTSDDECDISVTGSKSASAKIKMNDPFAFSSLMINSYALDRKESDKNISGVQHNETINGDGKHGMEFFKQSEFQRNMIGAGILTPHWTILNLSDGSSAIFNKGDQINFNTSGNYYASGALSHSAQGYCMVHGSIEDVGAIYMYTWALRHEAASGVALYMMYDNFKTAIALGWPVGLPFVKTGVIFYGVFLALQAMSIADMIAGAAIAEAPSGKMKVETPKESKRSCGVATAFKIIPLPPAACLEGYVAKCNNSRINDYVGQDISVNEKILSYCKSEENVDFRTERMKVGACNKQIKSINDKVVLETRPQRYRSADARHINTLTDAVGKWSDLENIYEENCGVCVKRNSINSYDGIVYSIDELSVLPKTVRTSVHCEKYTDEEGNTYAWLKNIKIIKPFDKYTFSNKEVVFRQIKNILSNKISECDAESTYSMPVDNEDILNNIKAAFLKMQIRDLDSCISSMMAVYSRGISLSDTTNECKEQISDNLENMATAACNDMLEISKNTDGEEYYNYFFLQNATSASCQDDKYNRVVSEDDNKFASVTRVGAENILSEYGYGELTTDDLSTSADGVTNITLHVPTTLKGKEFKTAKLGFFFAGEYKKDNTDPLRLYKNYRIINEDDLQRGYTLTVGSGAQITKGKYLYFYIQPLNDQGRPDPSYNPNVLFSPSLSNYTPETIANSNLVYSFKAYDKNDTGKISLVSPRTGKLWATTIDSEKLSPGDGDADGKYIEFADTLNEDGTAKVNGNNVLYTHGGFYNLHANVQVDSEDSIDSIVSGDSNSGVNKLLTSLVIKPIRTIFVGDYVCKRCLISDMSKCEKKTDSNIDDKDWYTADYKKVCDYDWQEGLLGKIALSFLRTHLLYIIWFSAVVFSVFVIGFQFITGEQKLDFTFMKKYLWRYALIMAFVNPQSLELYIRLFVKPAFNLADGLSAFVAGNFSSEKYTVMEPQNFFYSAFGPIDKILKFWINKYTFEKLLAILFSSWTGIIVVIILMMCFIFFMLSVIEAVILYIVILIKMSLYLSIGPVVFLLLMHEKTAGKFTDWWKTIAGCIAEQVMTFAGLSFFGTIYYHIIKGSMNFVYCWEPIIKIPVLDITLFSMWRISGTMPAHMAELSGSAGDEIALNTKGFNFLTAFILFIITCMMSEFVDKASTFGAKLFGQESSMPAEVKQILGQVKSAVKDLPIKGAKAMKDGIMSSKKKSGDDKENRDGAEKK